MIPQLVIVNDENKKKDYIQGLMKDHSVSPYNVFNVRAEEGALGIDEIRSISQIILTHTDTARIVAIHSFETATEEAQNALLKILEEKSLNNLFVLFANNASRVIPTITSRTNTVLLSEKGTHMSTKKRLELEQALKKIQSPQDYAFLADPLWITPKKEEALALIDEIIVCMKSNLAFSDNLTAANIIKKALQLKNQISSLNCNHQLAIDILLIFIHKTATMKLVHEKK